MKTNSKRTVKKYESFNVEIIKLLAERHGYTQNYIRMSVRGERTGVKPLQIAEEYATLDRQAKAAIKQANEKLA